MEICGLWKYVDYENMWTMEICGLWKYIRINLILNTKTNK